MSEKNDQRTGSADLIRKLVFSAICITLALVLSRIKLFTMPQGGSVSPCSMLFIVLVGYWYGVKAGVMAGLAFGLLRLALDAYVVHPVQYILDYLLAYASLGLFGFFRGRPFGLHIAYALGATGTFICNLISGVVFFGSYAPEGQNVIIYSAVYNLSHILPEMIITLALISMPPVKKAIEMVSPVRARGKTA